MLWLLAGLAVLWCGTGAGIYFSVRHSLYQSIDTALALDARLARFTALGDSDSDDSTARGRGQRLQDRLADYHDPQGRSFYQESSASAPRVSVMPCCPNWTSPAMILCFHPQCSPMAAPFGS
jgi:hypothetical protein